MNFIDNFVQYKACHRHVLELQNDLDKLQEWEHNWQMCFNPDKCEVLSVTNKLKNVIPPNYFIHGHKLNVVDKAKYLGVSISSKLSWTDHINSITSKANKTRGFLQRNLRGAPKALKSKAYFTFVRPTIEYASTVWDPHQKTLIDKVEMVQRKAARWVCGDWGRTSSVSSMLSDLEWASLAHRRYISKTVILYKIKHAQIAILCQPPYLYPTPNYSSTRGHDQQFFIVRYNVNSFGYSFFPSSV